MLFRVDSVPALAGDAAAVVPLVVREVQGEEEGWAVLQAVPGPAGAATAGRVCHPRPVCSFKPIMQPD